MSTCVCVCVCTAYQGLLCVDAIGRCLACALPVVRLLCCALQLLYFRLSTTRKLQWPPPLCFRRWPWTSMFYLTDPCCFEWRCRLSPYGLGSSTQEPCPSGFELGFEFHFKSHVSGPQLRLKRSYKLLAWNVYRWASKFCQRIKHISVWNLLFGSIWCITLTFPSRVEQFVRHSSPALRTSLTACVPQTPRSGEFFGTDFTCTGLESHERCKARQVCRVLQTEVDRACVMCLALGWCRLGGNPCAQL